MGTGIEHQVHTCATFSYLCYMCCTPVLHMQTFFSTSCTPVLYVSKCATGLHTSCTHVLLVLYTSYTYVLEIHNCATIVAHQLYICATCAQLLHTCAACATCVEHLFSTSYTPFSKHCKFKNAIHVMQTNCTLAFNGHLGLKTG